MDVTNEAMKNFNEIQSKIKEIGENISQIQNATREQQVGISQVNEAMNKIEQSSQDNLKVAENTEDLSSKIRVAVEEIRIKAASISSTGTVQISQDADTFFPWDKNIQIGLKTIDDQHKILIDLINDLYRAIRNDRGENVIDDICKKLLDYTDYHFGFEEKIFDKTGYAETTEHKKVHSQLVQQAIDMIEKYRKNSGASARDLMDFLKEWLTNHINKTDRRYVAHLKKSGIK